MMRGYGYGYPMMSGGGWFVGLLFFVFFVLVLALVVLLIIWAVQSSKRHPHPMQGAPGTSMPAPPAAPPVGAAPGHDEAVAIAKRRFASGEITKEQYDEIMNGLSGS